MGVLFIQAPHQRKHAFPLLPLSMLLMARWIRAHLNVLFLSADSNLGALHLRSTSLPR